MKKEIFRLIVFLIPLIAIFGFIEFMLGKIPTTSHQKRLLFEKNISSYQGLILGSSHSFYGINPNVWDIPVFNLANVSQSLYYDHAITLRYLDSLSSLKFIIIPISYFSLEYDLSNSPEYWRQFEYSKFWGIYENNLRIFDLRNFLFLKLYPKKDILKFIENKFRADISEKIDSRGWLPYENWRDDRLSTASAIKVVSQHNEIMNKSMIFPNTQLLLDLSYEAKKRNIKIIFVTLPVFKTYYQAANPQVLSQISTTMRSISKQTGFSYLNLLNDSLFDSSDFADPDHLNKKGSIKVSNILKKITESN